MWRMHNHVTLLVIPAPPTDLETPDEKPEASPYSSLQDADSNCLQGLKVLTDRLGKLPNWGNILAWLVSKPCYPFTD